MFTTYSKTTIVALLLVTAVIGAGITMLENDSSMGQFETDSEAADAQTFIENNFVIDDGSDETTQVQLVQRSQDGNALSKSALTANLELQQELLNDESISETLVEQRPVFSVANIVGRAAINQQEDLDELTLANQITAINQLDQAAFEDTVASVLSEDSNNGALDLMPTSYDDPGSTTAAAHLTIVAQATQDGSADGPNQFSQPVQDAQLEVRGLAQEASPQYEVFGAGIIFQEINQSLGDSIAIVGPLALLFVVVALTVAYRDLLDIVLGVVGILAVLIWTFGFMGWAGISFNQILISVPVLLIGLSIDYAIHVFMRQREQRNADDGADDVSTSMTLALGGVGVALVWVTATAAIGFLANLTSPIGPLQDFGIVSAVGVFAALFIFGALIPALKVEADELLERLGRDRHKSAFGTGDGVFTRVLSVGATASRRFPLVVVAITLVITAGGIAGATQVDTSFEQEDFLADEPPGWIQSLPGPLEPGEYG
ncbi:MAG: putative exporters of the RND superfamily, partial [halophilic archaeon J07HX5]